MLKICIGLAAEARLRGTVTLELAPGRRGPLDNSEADRRRPTRAVQVDSDSSIILPRRDTQRLSARQADSDFH
jgi:hypothetical protein